MADSLQNIDKKCIFRETFENEASVRRNGGTPTSATFTNGILTAGIVTYNLRIPISSTIRVRVRRTAVGGSGLVFITNSTTGGSKFSLQFQSSNLIRSYIGIYIYEGAQVLSSTSTIYDIVFTNNISYSLIYVNGVGHTASGGARNAISTTPITLISSGASCEILDFEVYNYDMTPNEIKALYENRRYRDVQLSKSEQLGEELITNGGFDDATGWTIVTDWSISGGKANFLDTTGGHLYCSANFTSGKYYKITYTISDCSGNAYINWKNNSSANLFTNNDIVTNGTYTVYKQAITNSTQLRIEGHSASSSAWKLDNLSVKEVSVLYTKPILDVCACNGVVRNKYSNGTTIPYVIPTSVSLVKDNDIQAMLFNGSTSKIDCGSYDTLVGDKTFIIWHKAQKYINNYNNIITNQKTILNIHRDNLRVHFTSDNSTAAVSATNSIIRSFYNSIIITRTSTGITNIYVGGILSGTANQSSGTPVAGTTNIIIGKNITGDPIIGYVSIVKIIDGILTADEIMQLYTSEKSKYGY